MLCGQLPCWRVLIWMPLLPRELHEAIHRIDTHKGQERNATAPQSPHAPHSGLAIDFIWTAECPCPEKESWKTPGRHSAHNMIKRKDDVAGGPRSCHTTYSWRKSRQTFVWVAVYCYGLNSYGLYIYIPGDFVLGLPPSPPNTAAMLQQTSRVGH